MRKLTVFFFFLVLTHVSTAQEEMGIIGLNDTKIYADEALESDVRGIFQEGTLVSVLEMGTKYAPDSSIDSDYNQFFWYKVKGKDLSGWIYGNALFHLHTAYEGRSEYANKYENDELIPYSIHQAIRRSYTIIENEIQDPFSEGSYTKVDKRTLGWWGDGFLIGLKHPDGQQSVNGNEEVLPIFPEGAPEKTYKNQFSTDWLQVISLRQIEHLFFTNDGAMVMTTYSTDGQSSSSVRVYELTASGSGLSAKRVFLKDSQ